MRVCGIPLARTVTQNGDNTWESLWIPTSPDWENHHMSGPIDDLRPWHLDHAGQLPAFHLCVSNSLFLVFGDLKVWPHVPMKRFPTWRSCFVRWQSWQALWKSVFNVLHRVSCRKWLCVELNGEYKERKTYRAIFTVCPKDLHSIPLRRVEFPNLPMHAIQQKRAV